MSSIERFSNTALGLNFLAWAAAGIWSSDGLERWAIVRICVALLNATVGCLLLLRAPLRRRGSLWACAMALPSFLMGGVAFSLAPPLPSWPRVIQFAFVLGTAVTVVSMIYLGRSFAILPARRRIVSRGTYRIVRHPIYAGELILIAAMFAAGPSWLRLLPLAAAVPLVVVRILIEEHLLRSDEAYRQYAQQVAWRLLPGIW